MAKNDKKEDVKPVAASEAEIKSAAAAKEIKSAGKKGSAGRKAVGLLILLLAGAAGFLAYDLAETKKLGEASVLQLQAEYVSKLEAVNARINALDGEIRRLKTAQTVAGGISAEEVDRRLAALKQEFAAVAATGEAEQNKFDANESAEAAVEAPAVTAVKTLSYPAEVLLASGAMVVRSLAENGLTFAYEAEVLQVLAEGNETAQKYVEAVQKYAASGITGKEMLIREFDTVYAGAVQPQVQAQEEKLEGEAVDEEGWSKLLERRMKELVVLRKTSVKPVAQISESDEVYLLVNNGNFAEALNKIKTDDRYALLRSHGLDDWMKQVQDYLDFERAINGLIMNSLANIKVKGLL